MRRYDNGDNHSTKAVTNIGITYPKEYKKTIMDLKYNKEDLSSFYKQFYGTIQPSAEVATGGKKKRKTNKKKKPLKRRKSKRNTKKK